MPSFAPNQIVDYTLPEGKTVQIVVTRFAPEKKKPIPKLAVLSGYELQTHKFFTFPCTRRVLENLKRNRAEEKKIPKKNTPVIFVDAGEEIRGVACSMDNGYLEVHFAGATHPIPMSLGDIKVCSEAFKPSEDKESPTRDWIVSSRRNMDFASDKSLAFTAYIKNKKTKEEVLCQNLGRGKPDKIASCDPNDRALEHFLMATQKWGAKYASKGDTRNMAAAWLKWYSLYRPFGYNEAEFFARTEKETLKLAS